MKLPQFALWFWLVVPLFGLGELAAHYHFASAAPEPDEWNQLTEPVKEWHQPGDLVVVAPYWAEPNARAVFGDTLMPLRDVARPDDTRYRRAIELSILGAPTELEGFRLLDEQSVGKFTLRLWENTQYSEPLLDFADRLGPKTTRVSFRRRSGETECDWNSRARVTTGTPALHGHPTFPRRRFQCSGGEWFFVGVTVIEDENYRPRRCIWAHPASNKETIIRFDDVELNQSIRGFGGISYFTEREQGGTPVELSVRVGNDSIGKFVHKDGDGWSGFEFPTKAYAGTKQRVEFRVESKRAHQREFCFQASVH